jgi:hypothetical protein
LQEVFEVEVEQRLLHRVVFRVKDRSSETEWSERTTYMREKMISLDGGDMF